jgi:hypothetical protein
MPPCYSNEPPPCVLSLRPLARVLRLWTLVVVLVLDTLHSFALTHSLIHTYPFPLLCLCVHNSVTLLRLFALANPFLKHDEFRYIRLSSDAAVSLLSYFPFYISTTVSGLASSLGL